MKKEVVILNGAPNSGKDCLSDLLSAESGYVHVRFKQVLYAMTAKHYLMDINEFIGLATDRDRKEEPSKKLGYISPRDALIHVSEDIIKPTYGDAYFGEVLAQTIADNPGDKFVVSDGGFEAELAPLDGMHDVCLVALYRDGCSFDGDSRSYLSMPDGEVHNNGTIDGAMSQLHNIIEQWRLV